MITIFFGPSASGKDTLLRRAVRDGYKPVVSYTTRPMRDGETDGVDYNFVTKEEFMSLCENGNIIESRSYNTLVNGQSDIWYYGSPRVNPDERYAAVVDVDGIRAYIREYGSDNLKLIYVKTNEEIREMRARARGSFDETEWKRRLEDDRVKFSKEAIQSLQKDYGRYIKTYDNDEDTIVFA